MVGKNVKKRGKEEKADHGVEVEKKQKRKRTKKMVMMMMTMMMMMMLMILMMMMSMTIPARICSFSCIKGLSPVPSYRVSGEERQTCSRCVTW